MTDKRNTKGKEGGEVTIRNLDAQTLDDLRVLREYFKVGTSSKAVLLAVKKFIPTMREVSLLRDKLTVANDLIDAQQWAIEQVGILSQSAQEDKKKYDRFVGGRDADNE